MIEGVVVKDLITHGDDRGFFREVVRVTDGFFKEGFGQLSHSLAETGTLKAWHGHRRQTQWTYCAAGNLKVALCDLRPRSPTFRSTMEFFIGESHPACVYSLPVGVVHGYRVARGPAHVIYVTSGTYDVDDEVRIPRDDPVIGYNWT